MQLPNSHLPLPEQSKGHLAVAQASPPQPFEQTHTPLSQTPLTQTGLQVFVEQSKESKLPVQLHLPSFVQTPLPLQTLPAELLGQPFMEQSAPEKPTSHSQWPSLQMPLFEHLLGQDGTEQSLPVKDGSQ